MHTSMILDTWLCCMCVWCGWNFVPDGRTNQRTNKAILGVGLAFTRVNSQYKEIRGLQLCQDQIRFSSLWQRLCAKIIFAKKKLRTHAEGHRMNIQMLGLSWTTNYSCISVYLDPFFHKSWRLAQLDVWFLIWSQLVHNQILQILGGQRRFFCQNKCHKYSGWPPWKSRPGPHPSPVFSCPQTAL